MRAVAHPHVVVGLVGFLLWAPAGCGKSNSARDMLTKGQQASQQEDFDSAIESFTEVINQQPDDPELYYLRGVAYLKKGVLTKARADFSHSIRLKPDGADGYVGRGTTEMRQGEVDKAIADFSEVIHLQPEGPKDMVAAATRI